MSALEEKYKADGNLSGIDNLKLEIARNQLTSAFKYLNTISSAVNLFKDKAEKWGPYYTAEQIDAALVDVQFFQSVAIIGAIELAQGIQVVDRTSNTTILGENMKDRVIPFAEKTGSRTLPWGTTPEKWAKMTSQERWKLNDSLLRTRINEGDRFRYIGIDFARPESIRRQFDLTGSELLRLEERGILYDIISREEVFNVIGRY